MEWENGSVIVTCERCATQFQLDESRVPEGGARVRCSRCKHAFVVTLPAGSPEQEIDRAASRALESGITPDVTQDLPTQSIAMPADDESDWKFNDDPPTAPPGDPPQPASARREAPAFAESLALAAEESDPFGDVEPGESLALASEEVTPPVLRAPVPKPTPRVAEIPSAADPEAAEELGSPVDWDIFEDIAAPVASVVAPTPLRSSAPVPALAIAAEIEAPDKPPVWLRRAAAGAGWFATAGLCAIALFCGLVRSPPQQTTLPDPAPGVALEQVRGRWLDNVSLGRLYVVSGRLHNTAPALAALPALVLELRDASGRAIGKPILLGQPSPSELLRTRGAGDLSVASSWLVRPLLAGETRDFEVVAWPLPAAAERFAIHASAPPGS